MCIPACNGAGGGGSVYPSIQCAGREWCVSQHVIGHRGCVKSSFPIIHKVGHVDNFVLSKFANKQDREISHFNYLSKHYELCKFTFKLIRLLTVSNLFALRKLYKVVNIANIGKLEWAVHILLECILVVHNF